MVKKKTAERKERERLGGWKCDGCFGMGWQPHTLTLASFGIARTGQNHGQLGKTSYVLQLLRSDGPKPNVFFYWSLLQIKVLPGEYPDSRGRKNTKEWN